jgi:hypothetical protein
MSPAALGGRLVSQPVIVALALSSIAAWRPPSRAPASSARWLVAVTPIMAGVVLLDALVVAPLGLGWLPADRLMDGLYWGLVLGGAIGFGALATWFTRPLVPALLALAVCALLAWGAYEPGLSLWPAARQWPKEQEVVRGLRMDALWGVIRSAPPGRVLFVRSGVPLDWRPEWWRAHTHITALTPLRTGRSIVGGTFTHPSPVAGLLYTGSAANRPLTRLAEERDGRSLFGHALETLDPETFNRLARLLGISTIVALEDDVGRAAFLTDNRDLTLRASIGPFKVFVSGEAHPEPVPIGFQRWRIDLPAPPSNWVRVPVAYSPLWVARAGGGPVPLRRDALGLVEVAVPAGAVSVELTHSPGAVEWAGLGLSLLSLVGLGFVWATGRRA